MRRGSAPGIHDTLPPDHQASLKISALTAMAIRDADELRAAARTIATLLR
jgi:hypothetical protein